MGKPSFADNKIRVTMKNTGTRDGDEVVQVYLNRPDDREGPSKTLRAYQRVTVKAGETRYVEMDFPRERFECWDATTNTMRVIPGSYELMVGTSSNDSDLQRLKVIIE